MSNKNEAQVPDGAAAQAAEGKSGKGDASGQGTPKPAGMSNEVTEGEGPVEVVETPPPADRMRPVRLWLWLLAAMVFAMVLVGGATRLTESGLSITEWKPITGVLPPLSAAEWAAEFEKYKQIPQYKEMFAGMSLAQYKVIFFWEWGHRLLGRLLGAVFVLPFVFFLFTGRIRGNLIWKLLGLLALGAVQGGIGWWMVKSGLAGRTEVAAERLAIHLLLAALTFVGLIWIALGLRKKELEPTPKDVRAEASGLIVVLLIQIGLGALVAGARAGLTYNTWPLMDGHLVPPVEKLMSLKPAWMNFFENPTMLQFQHRMFAYLVLLLIFGHVLKIARSTAPNGARRRGLVLLLLVLVQVALGVATLLFVVPAGKIPIHLALTHQGVAFLLLGMAVVHRAVMGKPEAGGPRATHDRVASDPGQPKGIRVEAPPDSGPIAT